MSLVDVLGDCVFDIKPWPLLGEYWLAQHYLSLADTRLTSVQVRPGEWVAPLIGGEPIRHKGMVVYWPVGVCREIQGFYDAYVEATR
jgi:hypothetical protein